MVASTPRGVLPGFSKLTRRTSHGRRFFCKVTEPFLLYPKKSLFVSPSFSACSAASVPRQWALLFYLFTGWKNPQCARIVRDFEFRPQNSRVLNGAK
jgi:hypothetical protein